MGYIFGPVPSRRLGRSLGVDLVPFKTCTYDCIYCQLGRTTNITSQRQQWVPLSQVIAELKTKLSSQPDYITLSGSGEPTLYSQMGEIINQIKEITDIPVAVLTNGSLLWQTEVRKQLMNADLVIPSLDAGDEAMFQKVNRPCTEISFDKMLQGLIDFRREFQGQYWLEVFLLAKHNALIPELKKLADCIRLINPDLVQFNTATRPTAEDYAITVNPDHLKEIVATFSLPAEIIADFQNVHQQSDFAAGRQGVLELLRRRPCSIKDIAGGLGMHRNEAIKYIEELLAKKLITRTSTADKIYYKAIDETMT